MDLKNRLEVVQEIDVFEWSLYEAGNTRHLVDHGRDSWFISKVLKEQTELFLIQSVLFVVCGLLLDMFGRVVQVVCKQL